MTEHDIQLRYAHRVMFTRGVFAPGNATLRELFAQGRHGERVQSVLAFIDGGLADSDRGLAAKVEAYLADIPEGIQVKAAPIVLPGGEGCKNDWGLVERIWREIHDHGLCRHSYVLAIGGGALLDLVGFATATAHRGVRLVRLPTTTLSQGDGGVGVKNGVNYFGKKNWVGCFTVPFAVVNDFDFLKTLPQRERRSGIIEGLKVALIRDKGFFDYIESVVEELARLDGKVIEKVIQRSCELHVNHIVHGGDPFELGSARPLDFGHWVAHKLEQISDFALKHGEAVAIGMAVDLIYSARIGLIERADCDRILSLMEGIGFALDSPYLHQLDSEGKPVILRGLEEFREHLGGTLTITLVPEIGRKIEVNEMVEEEILGALAELETKTATVGAVAVS
ncbi:MAG: 3-dehydroquinate synthase [Verrucomicrobiales bacterium]